MQVNYRQGTLFFLFIIVRTFTVEAQYYLIGEGTEQLTDGEIRLTEEAGGQIGAVWAPGTLELTQDFSVEAEVFFGVPPATAGGGADGMAFVMHNSCRSVGGGSSMGGSGIGYYGISPSVIVELDTYRNSSDPSAKHIGIQKNGNPNHNTGALVTPYDLPATPKDGKWHSLTIKWTAAETLLEVYFDGTMCCSVTGDIATSIFNGDSEVYWGFTASTGARYNEHKIKLPDIPDTHSARICEGGSVLYSDVSPAYTYDASCTLTWSPATGISDIHVPYPEFYPTVSTTYTLEIEETCGAVIRRMFNIIVDSYTSSSDSVEICEGDSYTWNGKVISQAGIYVDTLEAIAGCDSIDSLIVTVKPVKVSTTSAAICSGESYLFNGTSYSASGIYTATLTGVSGCDSIAELDLTVNKATGSTTSVTVCSGDSYLFNEVSYSTSGVYTAILTNEAGCDSIAELELTVNNPSTSTTTVVCNENSYLFNGGSFSEAGTYSITLTNVNGCDSIAKLVLTFNCSCFIEGPAQCCVGDTLYFSFNDSVDADIYWYFDGTEMQASRNERSLILVPDEAGTYTLSIESSYDGCPLSCEHIISVSPVPDAEFDYYVNIRDLQIEFINQTEEVTVLFGDYLISIPQTASWTVTNKDSSVTVYSDDNSLLQIDGRFGVEMITLYVENEYGCSDSLSQEIQIDETSRLYVPNAFCPTSAYDGCNCFFPKGMGIRKYKVYVYDKWGNLRWFSDKLTETGQPAEAWDGIYDGVRVKGDCYIWKIEATFITGEDVVKWGNVVLLD